MFPRSVRARDYKKFADSIATLVRPFSAIAMSDRSLVRFRDPFLPAAAATATPHVGRTTAERYRDVAFIQRLSKSLNMCATHWPLAHSSARRHCGLTPVLISVFSVFSAACRTFRLPGLYWRWRRLYIIITDSFTGIVATTGIQRYCRRSPLFCRAMRFVGVIRFQSYFFRLACGRSVRPASVHSCSYCASLLCF
jgi:hypothetical protein